jgi:hypothetical protein
VVVAIVVDVVVVVDVVPTPTNSINNPIDLLPNDEYEDDDDDDDEDDDEDFDVVIHVGNSNDVVDNNNEL